MELERRREKPKPELKCEKGKRLLRIVTDGRKGKQVTGRVEDEIPREGGVTENFILLLNINTGGKDTHTHTPSGITAVVL